MTDSNIRTAVAAWLADPTAAEATYRHISTWRTGEVTDMASLFCGSSSTASWATDCNSAAASFNEDISAWDTSGVRTMYLMFHSASSFNRPLGNWRVDKVTDMSWMFSGASAFDQDLGWCVEDDVDLRHSFENTPCASTSCGVDVQGASCPFPSPAPTPAPTTPRPTREDEDDLNVVALVASLCVVGAFLLFIGILYVRERYPARAKNAKVAAVPNNAATDDGDTITVEAPPGTLGLKLDGTSTRVKEVFSDSPLVGKVHPGDVLKSVNGVAVTGGKCLINAVAAADDGTNPRALLFLRKQQPAPSTRPAVLVRMGTVEAIHAADASAAAPVQATLVPHATVLSVQQP